MMSTVQARVNRQGPDSADHVDVLQNKHFMEDVLTIVSGNGRLLEDSLHSDIARISANLWRAQGVQ